MNRAVLLLCVLLGLAACGPARPPSPTEHRQDTEAERRNKAHRKAWMRERHRAPPEVDWKAIELRNGRAQQDKRNRLASMAAVASRWTERGSDNLAGRMHVAVPAPDGASLYAGSSKGGVWRGNLDGTGWTPIGDNIYGGAHWLAVVSGPTGQPSVVLRATDGGQVDVSGDDGLTWTPPAGLPSQVTAVRRVLVTLPDESVFLVLRWKDLLGAQLHGVYRSTDGAQSFQLVLNMHSFAGDIWAHRDGPAPPGLPDLYALRSGTLMGSFDNGSFWMSVGSLPAATSGELTGCEAGGPRLWAVLTSSGQKQLHRTDDLGTTWVYKTDVSDYWITLAASIVDPDLFAWGGVEVHRTFDGGDTFDIVNPWWEYYGQEADRLHADIPGLDVVPGGPGGEIWYISTDGGLYRSLDGLQTVQNLSLDGLRVSQYYSTHTSALNPDHVLAGAQDQGYQRAGSPPSGPGTTLSFDQLISGDYGHLTSSDGSQTYVYSVYPGFVLIQKNEATPNLYTADFPASESHSWLPFIEADPYHATRFFFCATHLYQYAKVGVLNSWVETQYSSYNFAASAGEYLTAVAFSPVDPQRAYAATNQGRLFWSPDHGLNWNLSATTGPSAHYFYGTAIQPSALDVDTVLVAGSGYGNPAVWRSTDGGLTFAPHSTGLPDTLVYCLGEADDGNGTLFAGTETSAYRRDAGAGTWIDIAANESPVTIYWSLETVPGGNAMRFGTYGRGIWDYSLQDPCVYEAYGVGLGGANVLALDSPSSTALGGTHQLDGTGGQALATGYLIYAPLQASLPLLGGTLLVEPASMLLLTVAADAAGELHLSFTMPSDPAFAGVPLNYQLALRDAGQPGGWAFSNGLAGVLCE